MFEKHVYVSRRQRLIQQIGSGVILFIGNAESSMNYKDNLYPFRQDSSFLYFFGIDKPNLAAILDVDSGEQTLYGANFTIEDLVWMGHAETIESMAFQCGIASVQPMQALLNDAAKISSEKRVVHYLPPYRPEQVLKLSALLNVPVDQVKDNASIKLIKAIVEQRSYKSEIEIEELNKAVNTTYKMQREVIRAAREGMTEAALAGLLHQIAIAAGGNLSFPVILTTNGQILHNSYTQQRLKNGQLVLCDCGAETSMHYAGDLTRTFPVADRFSAMQSEIYTIVLNAYEDAVQALKPGILFKDVHLLACETLVEGLKQIGLMKGSAQDAVHAGAHALFFPCGLGHMLGLDIHDMENLGEQYVGYTEELTKSKQFGLKSLRLGRALEPGFTLTVEPGIYFIPELIAQWKAERKYTEYICYDKLDAYTSFGGIRIEDDFAITEAGYTKIGEPFSYQPTQIEMWRRASASAGLL
jgi:Xaa-Pro aminopeptidase